MFFGHLESLEVSGLTFVIIPAGVDGATGEFVVTRRDFYFLGLVSELPFASALSFIGQWNSVVPVPIESEPIVSFILGVMEPAHEHVRLARADIDISTVSGNYKVNFQGETSLGKTDVCGVR